MSANQWPYVSRADAEKEIAHAVALERERIAGWLETPELSDAIWDDPGSDGIDHALANAIRNGAHNPQTPTSGDSRGLSRDQEIIAAADDLTDATGPQTPETGMDSCRPSPESEDA